MTYLQIVNSQGERKYLLRNYEQNGILRLTSISGGVDTVMTF